VNWRYRHFVVGFVTRCGFHAIEFFSFVTVYGVVSDVARWNTDGPLTYVSILFYLIQ
jgi:hypothetical protein